MHRILKRLGDCGYADEIDELKKCNLLFSLTADKAFKESKLLTERSEWNSGEEKLSLNSALMLAWFNMKDRLIKAVESSRALRLEKVLQGKWKERYQQVDRMLEQHLSKLPHDTIIPPFADIIGNPDFRSIVFDTPIEQALNDDMLQQAIDNLPTFTTEWTYNVTAKLLKSMQSCEFLGPKVRSMELAASPWICNCCGEVMFYPRILVHTCYYLEEREFDPPPENGTLEHYYFMTSSKPWDIEDFAFDQSLFAVQAKIIATCGVDPLSTTSQDMDAMNPILTTRPPGSLPLRNNEANIFRVGRWRAVVCTYYLYHLSFH